MTGSSPLARGTRRGGRRPAARRRFIPARAGNTGRRSTARSTAPVHPRSRGEHCPPASRARREGGSSPLARGTRRHGRRRALRRRFIPARAGNTFLRESTGAGVAVHPRSRGEHAAGGGVRERHDGSSPLARGTPGHPHAAEHRYRFIPARAGNTFACTKRLRASTVHPRSRGEHSRQTPKPSIVTGSSPLARGTRCSAVSCACRGSVHPRSRGEHWSAETEAEGIHGSSPLARGTPAQRPG